MFTVAKIRYFVMNAFFATSLYMAYFKGNAQAETVALFMAWTAIVLCIFVSLGSKSTEVLESAIKNPFSVPVLVDLMFDLSVVAVFIYANKWVVAAFYLIGTLCMLSFRESVNKYRATLLAKEVKTPKALVF